MTLTTSQRIERLRVSIDELGPWRAREHVDLDRWSFGGAPLVLGAAWPQRDGVQTLGHPEVAVPEHWPLDEAELELDVGGEALPHAGDWHAGGVLAEAEDLNQPLLARPVTMATPARWQALRVDGASVALGALKPSEAGDGLVLRVYEPQGARGPLQVWASEGWRVAEAVDLLERPLPDVDQRIGPFEVKSWRLART